MSIIADFSKLYTIEDYRTTIETKLSNIDVSILVLNAGYECGGPMLKVEKAEIEKMVMVNAL